MFGWKQNKQNKTLKTFQSKFSKQNATIIKTIKIQKSTQNYTTSDV